MDYYDLKERQTDKKDVPTEKSELKFLTFSIYTRTAKSVLKSPIVNCVQHEKIVKV